MLNVLVVSNGETEPLENTLRSLQCFVRETGVSKEAFKVYLQALCLESSALDDFFELNLSSVVDKDNGVYDGMNRLIDRVINLDSHCLFLNAGDMLNRESFMQLYKVLQKLHLSDDTVFYSDYYIDEKRFKSRVWPYLLKMPNHQAMIIPTKFFMASGFRFDLSFPIASDLHLKLVLWSNGLQYSKIDVPICRCESPGISGNINSKILLSRSHEMARIGKKIFGSKFFYIYFFIYLFWYLIKLRRDK